MSIKGLILSITLVSVLVMTSEDLKSQSLRLEYVKSFGSDTLSKDGNFAAGGDIFARISSITVNNDYLYVLDSDFKKIVIFDKISGKLIKVSLGGYGRGPGEFESPLSITSDDDNNFIVYDYGNRKLSFFDLEDGVYNEVKVPFSSRSITKSSIHIWIGALNSFDNYVYSFREGDNPTFTASFDKFIYVSQEELDYSVNGVISFVDAFNSDSIILASHIPTVWYKIGNGKTERFGNSVHPESKATIGRDGVRTIENHTAGICQLNNKYVVIMWIHFPKNSDMRHVSLDFYDTKGTYIDRVGINDKIYSSITCSKNSNSIYLATTNPYTRVEEFRFMNTSP